MFFTGLLLGVLFVTPCVIIYILIIKGADRYEPEPWWLLTIMFFWGAFASTLLAIIVGLIGQGFMIAAGADPSEPYFHASSATFLAPLTEECSKALGLGLLWIVSALWLKEVDGPLDGVIYGGVVGLGFTLTEDILYGAAAAADGGVAGFATIFTIRTVMAGLGHASFTALTGLGIGIANVSRSVLVKFIATLAGLAGAMFLHGLHNALVTFWLGEGEGFVIKLLLFWF